MVRQKKGVKLIIGFENLVTKDENQKQFLF